jgi:hypothetical protein
MGILKLTLASGATALGSVFDLKLRDFETFRLLMLYFASSVRKLKVRQSQTSVTVLQLTN